MCVCVCVFLHVYLCFFLVLEETYLFDLILYSVCVCVCVCVCCSCLFCFFLVLEETHLFDETRPHSSKNIRGLFCDTPNIESPDQLDWTDAQIVCWGECRYTDESCGKGPKKSCFTLK